MRGNILGHTNKPANVGGEFTWIKFNYYTLNLHAFIHSDLHWLRHDRASQSDIELTDAQLSLKYHWPINNQQLIKSNQWNVALHLVIWAAGHVPRMWQKVDHMIKFKSQTSPLASSSRRSEIFELFYGRWDFERVVNDIDQLHARHDWRIIKKALSG